MLLRAALIWLILVLLAIANGVVRTVLITPYLGEHAGHVVSTVTLCALIFLVSLFSIRWIGPKRSRDVFVVGTLWVLLTVAFEFLAGHYLFGNPWEKLLADYNVLSGRVWVLVLVTTFVSPPLTARLKSLW